MEEESSTYNRVDVAIGHMHQALDLLEIESRREDPSGLNHGVGPLDHAIQDLAQVILKARLIGCA